MGAAAASGEGESEVDDGLEEISGVPEAVFGAAADPVASAEVGAGFSPAPAELVVDLATAVGADA